MICWLPFGRTVAASRALADTSSGSAVARSVLAVAVLVDTHTDAWVGILLVPLPAAKAHHQVQCGLVLDVVVAQRASVLKLLGGKDEALLVRRVALLVLQPLFDADDAVERLHLEHERLARRCPHKDQHAGRCRVSNIGRLAVHIDVQVLCAL